MATSDDQKQAAFKRIEEASLKLIDLNQRPVPRDQHPKHHGCVRAKFVIKPGLDAKYRQGLFSEQAVYDAWVRFSNGRQHDDAKADAHGMAVKVMGVNGPKALDEEPDGRTQDFVMVDHPVFFLRGAEDYADFSDAVLAAQGKIRTTVRTLLRSILPNEAASAGTLFLLYFFPTRLGTLRLVRTFASKLIANPLTTRYWSTTPYRFGSGAAMKFTARPASLPVSVVLDPAQKDESPESEYTRLTKYLGKAVVIETQPKAEIQTAPNYLREAMIASLRDGKDAVFSFQVQLGQNNRSTPIEDPTVEWPEKGKTQPETVAWLWIQAQDFADPRRDAFAENLSFTPWHALKAHEPLGEINEIRKLVYKRVSAARHAANGMQEHEPQASDPDPLTVPGPARWGDDPSAFGAVLSDELDLIWQRRKRLVDSDGKLIEPEESRPGPTPPYTPGDEDARTKAHRLRALRGHVTGLAISGGGIRSGTFAVGFLQGLAALGLIRRFDYLSTVSGGGYAGAWLTAWLKREGGDPRNVEKMLSPSRVDQADAHREYVDGQVVDTESDPIRHLRAYSSYLFPQGGILSADPWTVVLIWLRNVVINFLMLLPAIMLVVVAVRLAVLLYGAFNPLEIESPGKYLAFSLLFAALGLLAGISAYRSNAEALRLIRSRPPADPSLSSLGPPTEVRSRVNRGVLLPAFLAFFLLTLSIRPLFWAIGDYLANQRLRLTRTDLPENGLAKLAAQGFQFAFDFLQSNLDLLGLPMFLGIGLFVGLLTAWGGRKNVPPTPPHSRPHFIWASFIAGATGGVLFVLVAGLIRAFARGVRPDLMAMFATPLGLLVVVAVLIVLVALLGRRIDEAEREWWARLSASVSLRAAIWVGLFATILYVPGLFLSAGPWLRTAIASGWAGSAAVAVFSGHYILPRLGPIGGNRLTSILALLSGVFLVGLVGAVALLASLLANIPSPLAPSADDISRFAYYLRGVNGGDASQYDLLFEALRLVLIGVASLVMFVLARRLIDVNLFSLNAMYANRLTRCYLGASRSKPTWEDRWKLPRDARAEVGAPSLSHEDGPPRMENPVTGFDPHRDDLTLRSLKIGTGDAAHPYLGPHLLINTSLNLVGENSLQLRDRKGDSFVLSPLYCGSPRVGYSKLEPVPESDADDDLTLGRAVSISGAAVDPNMSFYQSGTLTALLTLFNARLGYWIEKPGTSGWAARSPVFGDLILNEFFGRTNDRGDFVHISDGGHFENMGVYELIRRRCRYIVALDVGDDGDPSSDNLANLIRLCRIDFGVRIRVDTRGLTMQGPDKLTRSHVAVGSIHYEDVDRGEMPGVLVYVKSSLTGDEPPDVQKYARKDSRFPHQPTDLRQSFDEEQFESYRSLGDHIAWEVFADPVDQIRNDLRDQGRGPADSVPHEEYASRLFAAVQDRWLEVPDGLDALYASMSRDWPEIQGDLANRSGLGALSRSLYPDVEVPDGEAGVSLRREELHTVARMLAAMENAWLGLSMQRTSALPLNRGWMNAFRRWAGSDAFRRAWPILRSEYSDQFVRFCEDELHLQTARPSAIRLEVGFDQLDDADGRKKALDLMDEEFARDWPDEHRAERGVLDQARKSLTVDGKPAVWLMAQASSEYSEARQSPAPLYGGVILAVAIGDAADAPVEIAVWVRPPYRQIGLGSICLSEVMAELDPKLSGRLLLTRYPDDDPGEDQSYLSFLRFFSRYDFRPISSKASLARPGSTTLQRPA
ncbi:patatin-like phospholipase family protein [Paludisphaera rhizosphaerae]|uniref:patatin-like phospholipase family protein n=1 Tax=Paludisphaera rhizosphaerae TaxID=2711216 RepID=UPI0013EC5786|nr:patatin-like phospholipase family protein [Paludisphaera rhizosphaerae]